ncbi:MAG: ATP-binding protein [Bryobacteraceae bacterium]
MGHIHAAPDPVSRVLPLEHAGGRDRRWAMALEAVRARKATCILESPDSIEVAGTTIPGRRDTARALYILYRPDIPHVSIAALLSDPARREQFRDKVVFVGLTAQTAARDRLMTPLGEMMSGVEIHAQAYETLMSGHFLQPATDVALLFICAIVTLAAGATFAFLNGLRAYAVAALLVLLASAIPHIAFAWGIIVPYLTPVFAAWFSVAAAASWQHFVVRRQLHKSESDRARYQEAIHFVTHEMRSPLTAIQGSSELMGRYNLNEDKRRQMAQMINAESKRLARMIQTFLDMERLTDGDIEIRSEPVPISDLVLSCLERARPLAERKQIELRAGPLQALSVNGDRELMEYAVYNLLTNAVKYSPPETFVTASVQQNGGGIQVSVQDQGIGLDAKELKSIFKKIYRTRKAEASGEVGTGIGLSIVQQIVEHHHGHVVVTSEPGKGSCFTIVLPEDGVARG